MTFKKILSLLISVILLFSLTGCKNSVDNSSSLSTDSSKGEESTQKTRNYITLLYSAGDTFNPYTAKTNINKQLSSLLYDSLVKLDNNFKPINSIAKSVKISGKKCVVKLNDAVFSDGTSLNADDVVYSCNLALKAKNSYAKNLYVLKSVSAADSKTVEFTLKKSDPYFANLLDFPIIKKGSDKIKDSDSVVQPPIGSGKYKVNKAKNKLILNSNYSGKKPKIKTIKLINSPDTESVEHYTQIGAADIYYSDISDGTILRLSGQKYDINLNNLVYIGINQNYGALKENSMRQAIASAIDRSKICQDSYYNNALAATGFFSPVWEATKAVQNIQITANKQITIENLEKIGYNKLNSAGVRVNSHGTPLSFTLLVNSENRIRVAAAMNIASQLSEVGIKVTVVEKKFKAYKKALKKGDFQLFLGEVKLTDNMDISCLVTEGGSAAYGLPKEKPDKDKDDKKSKEETEKKKDKDKNTPSAKTAGEVVEGFYKGKNTIADIASVLQNDMPFVPVLYRTGVLFCNENIENIDLYSQSDIFFSIDSYTVYQ